MKKGFFRRRTSFIVVVAVTLLSVAGLLTYQIGVSFAHPAASNTSFSPLSAGKVAADLASASDTISPF